MYRNMEQWEDIRNQVLRKGVSKRQILRDNKMHWTTLEKILENPQPPGYRQSQPRQQPKIGPYLDRIRQIIKDDFNVHPKQRHTAKRIFDRIREEGYTGGQTQVKAAVRQIRATTQEVYVPLIHRPGEAQVDFGYAAIREKGKLRKVVFFVMSLPYSGAVYVQAFERICTEVFQEAHVRAFDYFGGVPHRISYDNEPVFVSKIIGAHDRVLTDAFLQLKSHYLFDAHFCQVRRPNEKGVVERMVRYVRQNFMVPVPEVDSLEEFNTLLTEACRDDLRYRARGKSADKKTLLEEDKAVFLALPEKPFDACRKVSTVSNSLSLARFVNNDYSVPVRWAHHPIVIKGYTDRVEISYRDEQIASHLRCWDAEQVILEPLHYLALIERKPGALDHARPLEGWSLPECFGVLRRRLEGDAKSKGTREYIRVLRLLEKHSMEELTKGVKKGLRGGAITRDAIAQFLIPQEDWDGTTFKLDGREHLRRVKVTCSNPAAYNALTSAGTGAAT